MIKVYGLSGKSGSGKSYQAINLCKMRGIESIIDDGLFISGGGILSGVSAKRQETKVKAIKTALFSDDSHRDAVVNKIKDVNPASVLVLGTSERMIERIVARLDLPEPEEIIYIDNITTIVERLTASKERNEMGKHVIPASAFQLKKDFSGYFMHPLRIIKGFRSRDKLAYRSVVRPSFSYLGKYTINNRAVSDIVMIAGASVKGIESVLKVQVDTDSVTRTGLTIWVSVSVEYGANVPETAKKMQHQTAEMLETMTAFHIKAINVEIKRLSHV